MKTRKWSLIGLVIVFALVAVAFYYGNQFGKRQAEYAAEHPAYQLDTKEKIEQVLGDQEVMFLRYTVDYRNNWWLEVNPLPLKDNMINNRYWVGGFNEAWFVDWMTDEDSGLTKRETNILTDYRISVKHQITGTVKVITENWGPVLNIRGYGDYAIVIENQRPPANLNDQQVEGLWKRAEQAHLCKDGDKDCEFGKWIRQSYSAYEKLDAMCFWNRWPEALDSGLCDWLKKPEDKAVPILRTWSNYEAAGIEDQEVTILDWENDPNDFNYPLLRVRLNNQEYLLGSKYGTQFYYRLMNEDYVELSRERIWWYNLPKVPVRVQALGVENWPPYIDLVATIKVQPMPQTKAYEPILRGWDQFEQAGLTNIMFKAVALEADPIMPKCKLLKIEVDDNTYWLGRETGCYNFQAAWAVEDGQGIVEIKHSALTDLPVMVQVAGNYEFGTEAYLYLRIIPQTTTYQNP